MEKTAKILCVGRIRVGGRHRSLQNGQVGHWTLLVIDHQARRVYHVDSLQSEHYRHSLAAFLDLNGNPLQHYGRYDWQTEGREQTDRESCGYRVLAWVRYLLVHFALGGSLLDFRLPRYPMFYPDNEALGQRRAGATGRRRQRGREAEGCNKAGERQGQVSPRAESR